MKAICPKCASVYRVPDEKIPEAGAQVKCPKCATIFNVRSETRSSVHPIPPSDQLPPPAPAVAPAVAAKPSPLGISPNVATTTDSLWAQLQPAVVPQPRASVSPAEDPRRRMREVPPASTQSRPLAVEPVASFVATTPKGYEPTGPEVREFPGATRGGVSAIRAQSQVASSVRPTSSGSSGLHSTSALGSDLRPSAPLEGYRVRTPTGLSYDFSGKDEVDEYLRGQTNVTGFEFADPGGDWKPASTWPGLKSGVRRQSSSEEESFGPIEPVGLVTGEGALHLDLMTAFEPDRRKPQAPAMLGWGLWLGVALSSLLLLLCLAATITRYGFFDLSFVPPLKALGINSPTRSNPGKDLHGAPPATANVQTDREATYSRAVSAGGLALRAKDFSKAALEFHRALSMRSNSLEALQGLAASYTGLGDWKHAEEAEIKIKALKP